VQEFKNEYSGITKDMDLSPGLMIAQLGKTSTMPYFFLHQLEAA
jgi:hypothetical protein